jgi:hypothetical protein
MASSPFKGRYSTEYPTLLTMTINKTRAAALKLDRDEQEVVLFDDLALHPFRHILTKEAIRRDPAETWSSHGRTIRTANSSMRGFRKTACGDERGQKRVFTGEVDRSRRSRYCTVSVSAWVAVTLPEAAFTVRM